MTLLDTFEPLFRRICELNMLGRTGGRCPEYPVLRREISGRIDKLRSKILSDPQLEHHWSRLEMPVLFFVDSMISESGLPVASEWNQHRLAYDYRELAGDQKFFDLMEQELADSGADASVRLGFYYTCLGLGFTGFHGDRPAPLRAKSLEMLRRVDPALPSEVHLKLAPDAYAAVDTRDILEPPAISPKILWAFFVALCVLAIAVAGFLYEQSSGQLRRDLQTILSHAFSDSASHLKIKL